MKGERVQKADRQTALKRILAELALWFVIALVILGVCYGLWRVVASLPVNILAAWALLATALIPLASWAAWYFGHTEVRGWLSGVDKAIDKMMGTATEVATLRGQVRQQEPPQMPAVQLPEIIEIRPRLAQGREVIDL